MAKYNLAESTTQNFSGGRHPAPDTSEAELGVFISYNRRDFAVAQKVALHFEFLGIPYYFDRNDRDLQTAGEVDDDPGIVKCIEKGLDACDHLLGIITNQTKGSWWVPYEIGYARAVGKFVVHLIDRAVKEIPSYIIVGEIVPDYETLLRWIPKPQPSNENYLINLSLGGVPKESPLDMLPLRRSLEDIRFTAGPA